MGESFAYNKFYTPKKTCESPDEVWNGKLLSYKMLKVRKLFDKDTNSFIKKKKKRKINLRKLVVLTHDSTGYKFMEIK